MNEAALHKWLDMFNFEEQNSEELDDRAWKQITSFENFMKCLMSRNGDKGAGLDRFTLSLLQRAPDTVLVMFHQAVCGMMNEGKFDRQTLGGSAASEEKGRSAQI